MSIKGFKSQQALSRKLANYTEDQSVDQARYATIQEMSGRRHALDVLIHGAFQVTIAPLTVGAGSNIRVIKCAAHGASANDIIRLSNGTQFSALSVPDANTIISSVELDIDPTGYTFTIWRHITPAYDSDGNAISTSGPLKYNIDGVSTIVNRDTSTPANTRALPVEIMGASGMVLNVTTGDLNIQSNHADRTVNAVNIPGDSIKIGDGTDIMLINASGEAQVKDADLLTAVGTKVTAIAALAAGGVGIIGWLSQIWDQLKNGTSAISGTVSIDQATANANEVVVKSITAGSNLIGKFSIDQATANANEVVVKSITAGSNTIGKVDLNAGSNLVGKFSIDQVTANANEVVVKSITAGSNLIGKFSIDQVTANANEVVLKASSAIVGKVAIDQTTPGTTNAVEVTNAFALDATLAKLTIAQATALGTNTGAMVMGSVTTTAPTYTTGNINPLSLTTSGLLRVFNNPTSGTITNTQKSVGLTEVRATVSGAAPGAGRKRLYIKPSKNNAGAIYLGATGVTTANGLEIIGPDRMEFLLDASDYYLISDTAGQVVEIVEVV